MKTVIAREWIKDRDLPREIDIKDGMYDIEYRFGDDVPDVVIDGVIMTQNVVQNKWDIDQGGSVSFDGEYYVFKSVNEYCKPYYYNQKGDIVYPYL